MVLAFRNKKEATNKRLQIEEEEEKVSSHMLMCIYLYLQKYIKAPLKKKMLTQFSFL